jgi:putative mRNA 3-end processing factor
MALIELSPAGLYCPAGGFHIDPWRPVDRAVITHAHSDHARRGMRQYLAATPGRGVLADRVGLDADIATLAFGEALTLGDVRLSLHPAGHILGSAQVRVERAGEVWVVSGDYKVAPDRTCDAFEPVRCHTFITECTFGLPVYRWAPQAETFAEVNAWWRANRDAGRVSAVGAYSLGKAQRVLAGLDPGIGPIFCHEAVEVVNRSYRAAGIALPDTRTTEGAAKFDGPGAIVVAPPQALDSAWLRRFGDAATAFASGWMAIRGMRRRQGVDRGFVLSDHADWPGLAEAIHATGAERVLATHGQTGPLVRWLRERGLEADGLRTAFQGEREDTDEPPAEADPA